MIKIETIDVMGFKGAIKSMRNSFESWDKSDSFYSCYDEDHEIDCANCQYNFFGCNGQESFFIGKNDMSLAKKLIKAGKSDRKSFRMIHVQADVTAPLYWWKEYDTYKVATTANSTSTMHTLHKRDLTLDDFSREHLLKSSMSFLQDLINEINRNRHLYTKGFKDIPSDDVCGVRPTDKTLWWQMIQLLPSSFNQMRTIDLSYETLFSIYHERRNHRLNEWHQFCDWIESLPYMGEFLEGK